MRVWLPWFLFTFGWVVIGPVMTLVGIAILIAAGVYYLAKVM